MRQLSASEAESRFSRLLEESGYKKTPERLAVIKAIYSSDSMLCVKDLLEMLSRRRFRVSRATMYNVLALLCGWGLVEKIRTNDGRTFYGRCSPEDDAVLLKCSVCGGVMRVFFPEWKELYGKISDTCNFTLQNRKLLLYGLCHKCKKH